MRLGENLWLNHDGCTHKPSLSHVCVYVAVCGCTFAGVCVEVMRGHTGHKALVAGVKHKLLRGCQPGGRQQHVACGSTQSPRREREHLLLFPWVCIVSSSKAGQVGIGQLSCLCISREL